MKQDLPACMARICDSRTSIGAWQTACVPWWRQIQAGCALLALPCDASVCIHAWQILQEGLKHEREGTVVRSHCTCKIHLQMKHSSMHVMNSCMPSALCCISGMHASWVQGAGHPGMPPVVVAGVVIVLHPVACICSGCEVL